MLLRRCCFVKSARGISAATCRPSSPRVHSPNLKPRTASNIKSSLSRYDRPICSPRRHFSQEISLSADTIDLRTVGDRAVLLARAGKFAEAEALVAQIAGQASIPIEILVDAIDSALKANALDIAKSFLVKLCRHHPPSVKLFNRAIAAMAGARRVKDCEAIRKLMDDKEIAPDRDTFIMMLDAYCRVQDVDKAMNMLNILREQRLADVPAYTNVIKLLLEKRQVAQARDVFHSMELDQVAPDEQLLTVLGHGLTHIGHAREAAELLEKSEKQFNVPLSPILCSIIMRYYAEAKNIHKMEALYSKMLSRNMKPDLAVYTDLLIAYGQLKQGNRVVAMLEKMLSDCKPDVIAYNAAVSSLARCGLYKEANELMEKMKADGTPPNFATYRALICSICARRNLKEAEERLRDMEQAGFKPDFQVYLPILLAYQANWDVYGIKRTLLQMQQRGVKPDARFLRSAANTARGRNMINEANEWAKQANELESARIARLEKMRTK